MEIKYQQKSLLYQSKQKTYRKVKQFVLQQLPQLSQKNWTFTYLDAQCDQVIIGDNEDFESTIDYYQSIQQKLVLIVKQMWWKHKKVHSRSKLVKQLLSRKSFQKDGYKVEPFKLSDSDSDDDFINIDIEPGQIYIDDSEQHVEEAETEKNQANTKGQQSFENRDAKCQLQQKNNTKMQVTVAHEQSSEVGINLELEYKK